MSNSIKYIITSRYFNEGELFYELNKVYNGKLAHYWEAISNNRYAVDKWVEEQDRLMDLIEEKGTNTLNSEEKKIKENYLKILTHIGKDSNDVLEEEKEELYKISDKDRKELGIPTRNIPESLTCYYKLNENVIALKDLTETATLSNSQKAEYLQVLYDTFKEVGKEVIFILHGSDFGINADNCIVSNVGVSWFPKDLNEFVSFRHVMGSKIGQVLSSINNKDNIEQKLNQAINGIIILGKLRPQLKTIHNKIKDKGLNKDDKIDISGILFNGFEEFEKLIKSYNDTKDAKVMQNAFYDILTITNN